MTISSHGTQASKPGERPLCEHAMTDGWAAAALLAAGVGCATLGILTAAAAASPAFAASLNWYDPVGPLSGKSAVPVVLYFASWLVLARVFHGRNVRLRAVMVVTAVLIGLGLLLTFPPVFELLAGH